MIIDLELIAGWIGTILAIGAPCLVIVRWILSIVKRIEVLEKRMDLQEVEMNESKEERLILLKSQLACLKGLHNDLNCNGPVTQGIADLEEYLIKKSHQ